jgi:hypothetical protein
MSYENTERAKSRQSFKTVSDLVMGIFYIALGGVLIFVRKMGTMDIPKYVAYSLGPIMAIGGVFRFYRGFATFLPAKKEPDEVES